MSLPMSKVQLRDYQLKVIEDVRKAITAGNKRIIVCAPVGAGKAVIMAAIAASAHGKGRRVLILAGRIELVRQARKQCIALGVPEADIGVQCGAEPGRRDSAPVQVCSVPTVTARGVPVADVTIHDEAHHSSSVTWHNSARANPNSILIGFTATPIRYDNKGLGSVFQTIVFAPSPKELIERGFLVDPIVHRGVKDLDLSSVRTRGGDYVSSDLDAALDRQEITGDAVSMWKRHAYGLKTLAFCVNVKHSLLMVDAFLRAGIPAAHVDATTPADERKRVFEALKSGEILVLSNVMIATEGTDVPEAKCCIMANPTKSVSVYLQCTGRIQRVDPAAPESRAFLLDLAGNCVRHGMPADDREWTLEGLKPTGSGEAPVKRCNETECKVLSAVAARFCKCGAPFHPKCPRCKKRSDRETGLMTGGCRQCSGVVYIEDPHSPPPTAQCPCCSCVFVPYRDITISGASESVEVTEEQVRAARVKADPPSGPQIEALKRLNMPSEGLTRRQASAAIEKAVKARDEGKPSPKQAYLLRRHGYNPEGMTFRDALRTISSIKAGATS